VVPGANVENASYGLSMCAERTAAFRAVSEGVRRFVAVAVVASNDEPTWPCGACRQVLYEFGPEMVVISEGLGGARQERRLTDLLPDAFGPADLA
jgi:cytidine deaminase